MATQKIDPLDYLEIKDQYNSALNELKEKLETLCSGTPSIENLLKKDIKTLMTLASVFEKGKIEDKRSLVQILYPEKLLFYETLIQNTKSNEMLKALYRYKAD